MEGQRARANRTPLRRLAELTREAPHYRDTVELSHTQQAAAARASHRRALRSRGSRPLPENLTPLLLGAGRDGSNGLGGG